MTECEIQAASTLLGSCRADPRSFRIPELIRRINDVVYQIRTGKPVVVYFNRLSLFSEDHNDHIDRMESYSTQSRHTKILSLSIEQLTKQTGAPTRSRQCLDVQPVSYLVVDRNICYKRVFNPLVSHRHRILERQDYYARETGLLWPSLHLCIFE